MNDRRALPAALKRELMEEAGARCAVPTCRGTLVLEFAHIVPWSETQDDSFDNLIVLCAVCHGMYDREKRIGRAAIRAYKQNLAVLNGRYNDFERRLLEEMHARGSQARIELEAGTVLDLSIRNLVRDGLVTSQPGPGGTWQVPGGATVVDIPGFFPKPAGGGPHKPTPHARDPREIRISGGTDIITLTDHGRAVISRWFGGEHIAVVSG